MTITIYHNPRCSKSRETLQIIRDSGVEPSIVDYLREPPAAATTMRIAKLLGKPVAELLRRGEQAFRTARDLPDLGDDALLAAWIETHPEALERPIVVDFERPAAVIGRPPENVVELLHP